MCDIFTPSIVQGPALALFLSYFAGTSSTTSGYAAGIALILLAFLSTTVNNVGRFKATELGMQCRIAFTVLIYKKVSSSYD